MLSALLWPVVLVLIYVLLFAIVLFLTWRFTRDTNREEPIEGQSLPEEHSAGAGTRRIA